MAEYHEFYQRAYYYDIVFKRDVSREVDFLIDVYRSCHGRSPSAVLDLACGPGYHARTFAKGGARAYGLDLRKEMTDFADEQAKAEGVEVTWFAADMRHFQLDQPVDIVFNMFDGIDCLNTNADLIDHFNAVAANLTPGGLYFFDVTNPVECSMSHYPPYRYAGERDGISVEILWTQPGSTVDPLMGIAHTNILMRVNDHGREILIHDSATERYLTAQEIYLLCQLSGSLAVAGFYGDFDLNQPFDSSPDTRRMVVVLQKVG